MEPMSLALLFEHIRWSVWDTVTALKNRVGKKNGISLFLDRFCTSFVVYFLDFIFISLYLIKTSGTLGLVLTHACQIAYYYVVILRLRDIVTPVKYCFIEVRFISQCTTESPYIFQKLEQL